jgi:hypothetical protein
MVPYSYQEQLSHDALEILRAHGIVYLAMEERTGKTLTAILACEKSSVSRVLVITKKKALAGWQETLNAFPHMKQYTVTNYHQAKKFLDPSIFDLIILDESHNYISGFPKVSKLWKDIANLTEEKPIIYISATPYAQGPHLLYHQFALSTWSPWRKYSNAYSWFRTYGLPNTIWLNSRQVEQYNKVKNSEVLLCCEHLFITKTRKELDFMQEPVDSLHYIQLSEKTKELYNRLQKDRILEELDLVADTVMKLRVSLHMLEGGVAKIDGVNRVLANEEKIDYIKAIWGDHSDLVIMYNYISEGVKLKEQFTKAVILQATSFAEGVDLSHIRNLVIYSQDFSTARHTQRRARQANKNRTDPITVHYILVKDAISDQVYNTVTEKKQNFVDSVFERNII